MKIAAVHFETAGCRCPVSLVPVKRMPDHLFLKVFCHVGQRDLPTIGFPQGFRAGLRSSDKAWGLFYNWTPCGWPHQFLTPAGFSQDKHGKIGSDHKVNLSLKLHHHRACSQNLCTLSLIDILHKIAGNLTLALGMDFQGLYQTGGLHLGSCQSTHRL